MYLVTDRRSAGRRSLADVVRTAVRSEVSVVQYRDKDIAERIFIDVARELKSICEEAGATFIINDRVGAALAAGAHGVHLGEHDMHPADARRLLGPQAIIGATVHNLEELHDANAMPVDYIGLGPVFATNTKQGLPNPWGLLGLEEAVRASKHSVVAIGGIKPENSLSVMKTGVCGIAIASAICGATDIESTVRQFAGNM